MNTIRYKPIAPVDDILHLTDREREDLLQGKGLSTESYENICEFGGFLLSQTAYQGSHLLYALTQMPDIKQAQMPVILLVRRLIEVTDSISNLLRQSLGESCQTLLRAVLEIHFTLSYLLEDDTLHEDRATAFLVWSYCEELKGQKLCDHTTDEGAELLKYLKEDKLLGSLCHPSMDTKTQRDAIKASLARPEWAAYLTKYQSFKNKSIKWYQIMGINDLFKLSEHLHMQGTYKVLYSPLSGKVHGMDVFQSVLDQDGKQAFMANVRKVDTHLHQFGVLGLSLATSVFLKVITTMFASTHPYRLKFFAWYTQIQPAIEHMREMKVQFTEDP